ncbi:Ig-like domain-containing protein [Pseudomonas sp. ANT_H12B]|uniref:Ig-like domain-containing protein n=1 Tax=Pseudomonas sp. ANT_H12B TaxID=2597348 RepID=UPI0011F036CE|nr:Ig-like domain-containing protein [Pseudomonas sp. ANT_H12B]KAA0974852.1 virulence plasmid 28 protein [Pseudomonas sp. ANT_H12B]
MTESERPIQRLLAAVLGVERLSELNVFNTYIEQHPSVFELVKLGGGGLQALGLHHREAHALIARANALATLIAREFREEGLRPSLGVHFSPVSPVSALVQGPTYSKLFSPNYALCSPKNSIQSSYSTTAYLVELREWVSKLEESGSPDSKLLLDTRRPDLGKTYIDHLTVDRIVPSLEVVMGVLAGQISNALGEEDVDAVLRSIRYPHGLPHDQDYQSIEAVLKLAGYESLGDIVRLVDLTFPYFIDPRARGSKSDISLRLSLELGSVRQALLLEAEYFPVTSGKLLPRRSGDFYKDNFGYMGLLDLQQLWVFYLATQLDQKGVEALFAIGDYMPLLSENAPALVDPDIEVTGAIFGAAFIHGEENPPIRLERTGPADNFELQHVGGIHEHRMDRINRVCRLNRWLGLSSGETDQLLMAANHAERRGKLNTAVWITDNVLRAVGLFQEFRAQYQCPLEDFAAMIDVLSVYGMEHELSHFDRVYNSQTVYIEALRIDNVEFAIIPRSEVDQATVHQICSALQINFETYRYLATVIANAYAFTTHMPRSLVVFSSFYRLVRLARLFGVTPVEATALLQTLGGDIWLAEVAGEPRLGSFVSGDETDVLNVMRALMECVQWCKTNDLTVLWLVQHIGPVSVPTVATEVQQNLLRQLHTQVQPVLFLEALLLEEGVRAPQKTGDWLKALEVLVDPAGLVKGRYEETELNFLQWATEQINLAVQSMIPNPNDDEARDHARKTLLSVLLRIRAEQHAVVHEALAVYLDLRADCVPGVLFWSQGDAYTLLERALAQELGSVKVKWTAPEPEPVNPFLKMLIELERRSRIVTRLGLSAEMLNTLLAQEQFEWFSLESRYEISIKTLYYLVFYTRLLLLARQPEAKVLDYLQQVNQLPEYLDSDPRRLVRDAAAEKLAALLGCGIRHVLDCVAEVVPVDANGVSKVNPVLCNLAQLDLLIRTQELAKKGLDAATGFLLGGLAPRSLQPAFSDASQRALEAMAKPEAMRVAQTSGELGQSVSFRCVVDSNHLIANLAHDYVEFECWVLDFYGDPLKGVPVHWLTTRGLLRESLTWTDAEGKTTVQLQAGSTMGTAYVSYRLDLREAAYAPAVVIGCDEESLDFPSESMSPLPKEPILAGGLGKVEIKAVLVDEFGNVGAGRQVIWRTTLGDIQPGETFTDDAGITRIWLSSQEAGETEVSVTYLNNETTALFNGKVTFKGMPHVQDHPYAISPAVQGRVLSVQCKVVDLDGLPVADKPVQWWTDLAPTKISSISDEFGLCTVELKSITAGPLTVYVQHGSDSVMSLVLQVMTDAVIQDYSADQRLPVAGASKPSLFWVDIREQPTSFAPAVPLMPIEWTVDTVPSGGTGFPAVVTLATDLNGRSTFAFQADKAGKYQIVAKKMLVGQEEEQVFEVEVIPAIAWRVVLTSSNDPAFAEEVIIPGSGELKFYTGFNYELRISTSSSVIHGKKAALGWSSRPDYPRPGMLGMTFDPPLAHEYEIGGSAMVWKINIEGNKRGPFTLGLYLNELDEGLALDGSVSRSPS